MNPFPRIARALGAGLLAGLAVGTAVGATIGATSRGDFAGLLRRMVKDKITVSSVAIGKDADVQLMVDVAKWGKGRFYYTEDSQTIPRIFTLETQLASKASIVEQPFRPQLTAPGHEAMQDIDAWVQADGDRLLFVYGEWDPWTGGAFELGDATDSASLVVDQGTHGANIRSLAAADQTIALDKLEAWSGVTPDPAVLLAQAPRPPRVPASLLHALRLRR